MKKWTPSTSNAPTSTASGITPSVPSTDQIERLIPDGPLAPVRTGRVVAHRASMDRSWAHSLATLRRQKQDVAGFDRGAPARVLAERLDRRQRGDFFALLHNDGVITEAVADRGRLRVRVRVR